MVCLEFVKSRKIKLCTNYDIILQQMQYQIRYKLLDCPLVLVSCYLPKVYVKSIHTPIYLGMSAYNQKLSCSVLHWSIWSSMIYGISFDGQCSSSFNYIRRMFRYSINTRSINMLAWI